MDPNADTIFHPHLPKSFPVLLWAPPIMMPILEALRDVKTLHYML